MRAPTSLLQDRETLVLLPGNHPGECESDEKERGNVRREPREGERLPRLDSFDEIKNGFGGALHQAVEKHMRSERKGMKPKFGSM